MYRLAGQGLSSSRDPGFQGSGRRKRGQGSRWGGTEGPQVSIQVMEWELMLSEQGGSQGREKEALIVT